MVPLALIWAPTMVLIPTLITTRNARYLSYVQLINVIARIGFGITLLVAMPTVIGVIMGYFLGFLATTITLLVIVMQRKLLDFCISKNLALRLLRAGVPMWLPNIITELGTQLAVVFTYSIGGAVKQAIYIVQTIALTIDVARKSVTSALIPSIAINRFSPERLAQTIRLIYTLLLPLNMVLIFYPEPFITTYKWST